MPQAEAQEAEARQAEVQQQMMVRRRLQQGPRANAAARMLRRRRSSSSRRMSRRMRLRQVSHTAAALPVCLLGQLAGACLHNTAPGTAGMWLMQWVVHLRGWHVHIADCLSRSAATHL